MKSDALTASRVTGWTLEGMPMIKSAVIAMTMLGCDCDAKVCTYIGEAAPQWDTIASCEAAMKSQVLARSKLNYPLITAECRATTSEPAIIEAKSETPVAAAASEPETTHVAGERPAASVTTRVAERAVSTFRQTADGYDIVKAGISAATDSVIGRAASALSATAGWLSY
jgi:hypothetical protein